MLFVVVVVVACAFLSLNSLWVLFASLSSLPKMENRKAVKAFWLAKKPHRHTRAQTRKQQTKKLKIKVRWQPRREAAATTCPVPYPDSAPWHTADSSAHGLAPLLLLLLLCYNY
jgi:hypothetical protein